LLVDIRHDLATTYLVATDDADPQQIETEFAKLEAEARERLAAEGIADDQMKLQRAIDMRYLGQWRSLAVPVGAPLGSIEDAVKSFHDGHQREYNYRRDQAAVEIYRLNLTAVGLTSKVELARHAGGNGRLENRATRRVLFDDSDQPVETPIYWRDDLDAGTRIVGPAVIEQLDSTTVVPPGIPAEVDPWMNIRLYVSQASR
jgi:N-methylhydantoinase A